MSVFNNAKFIKATEKPSDFSLYDPAPFFRKEFMLERVENARIYVCSPGFAKYYINGRDITDDLFISAISDYTKILWYNEYDVTSLLREGTNTVCVIAGNGFFNEPFRTAWDFDKALWRDSPQFILHLTVGKTTALVSDNSWKCSRDASHIVYNNIRSGEYWDMRKKDDSWMSAGFDDSAWQNAVEKENITAKFMPTLCQPVREAECIKPKSIIKTERGYLADFGVNMSGYAKVCLKEERGKEITFYYTEEVDKNGAPSYNNLNSKNFYPESPFHINKLTASGDTDVFKPHLCYHGFRYILIEGALEKPDIVAYFTHQDIARKSEFDCGNEILNFIYEAGIRSTYSNMFWCLTDCPTREKQGWMNDAQASTEQVLINFDSLPLFEKWYEDMLAGMFPDGSLHGTVPAPDWPWGHKCGPVCDLMLFELPYRVYLYTGKKDMLVRGIPYFERYIAFLEKKLDEGYQFILDDWTSNVRHAVPHRLIADIYLLKAYDIAGAAHDIAKTGCDRFKVKSADFRKTLASRYIDGDGYCIVSQQTAVAMLIGMKVKDDLSTLAKQLVEIIESDNYMLKSGMVGIQFIYYALSDIGRGDIAYRLLTESRPGYRSWYESGTTTLWEKWDGEDKDSHNHHMYSGVIAWFYRCLLGITPCIDGAGFKKIKLCPEFIKELGFVRGSMQTVRGKIEASIYYKDGGFEYTVDLPGGIEATFNGQKLSVGKNKFYIKGGK